MARRINIFYGYTDSPNGGFGVLGAGFLNAFKKDKRFKLVGTQDFEGAKDHADVVFTYGNPDLVHKKITYFGIDPLHIHYFVWESSELPKNYAKTYSKVDVLLTSNHYHKRIIEKNNNIKIHGVLHHAIDERWQYKPRIDDGVFTFVHYNAYEYRKGYEYVLDAFTQEFRLDEPVRLLMKARERLGSIWLVPPEGPMTLAEHKAKRENPHKFINEKLTLGHPQIREVIGHLTEQQMLDLFKYADCGVFPAKGEGWSLPPFEMMAMGVVPIIPTDSCFSEWYDPETMIGIGNNGYLDTRPRLPGYMFSRSTMEVRRKMRWAFEHQEELKVMGKIGSARIHEKYNWGKIMNDLYNFIIRGQNV